MKAILGKLGINELNNGRCTGPDGWITGADTAVITSTNPTTGKSIAAVTATDATAYDQIVQAAVTAFQSWRETPGPKRGQLIRDLGNALRDNLEPLGELVSLEMGKIRVEGIGEVQEM
ncbi:MAG: aldehyde dehydrogenase family protein, partial [Anaerolineales bacterium]|nr:aldehyde dehydrogenase family protein [Anaerolineales bacterium]